MRLIGGVLAAALLAALGSDAAVFGIAVWKIALALLGAGIFILGGRGSKN
jgi:type IV secretory pathway TrbD component